MKILQKPIADLTEADLQELVEGAVEEHRQLDYKRELPGQSDRDRREFRYDASSFANSGGGAILYGVPETNGVPTSLAGLEGNPDEAVQRIDSMLLSGIDPRPRVDVKWIRLASSRFVVVVRVPRSFTAPHMVTLENAQRFYARNSAGRYQLDVRQIRTAFVGGQRQADRIRDFRLSRLAAIMAGETPVPLDSILPAFVLHIVPLSAGDPLPETVDLAPVIAWRAPLVSQGNLRRNFDGVVGWEGVNAVRRYVQLMHNGTLETVCSAQSIGFHVEGPTQHMVRLSYFEGEIWKGTHKFIAFRDEIGGSGPFIVMASLLGVRHSLLATGERGGVASGFDDFACDREHLVAPDALIEDEAQGELETALRPIVDRFRNAFGHPHSPAWASITKEVPS